jgi:hypothetical protein
VLTRDDVRPSTAILNPNIPGSSTLQLSWIWQTSRWHLFGPDPNTDADAEAEAKAKAKADAEAEADAVLECKFPSIYLGFASSTSQLSVFIGCAPELRRTDGERNLCSSRMRCSGQSATS